MNRGKFIIFANILHDTKHIIIKLFSVNDDNINTRKHYTEIDQ